MRRLRTLATAGLAAGTLALVPVVSSAQEAAGSGAVSGVVRDSTGVGISGVEVSVGGTALRTHTDAQGEFRLTNIPAGTVSVGVRRLGFLPRVLDVVIEPLGTAVMSVVVTPLAHSLATVFVRGHRRFEQHGRLAGFYRRRARSSGGHYITREQIDQRNPAQLTDLFRNVPGARIHSGSFTNAVRFRGMRCAPLVWLDGFPATAAEFDLDTVDPYIVEGIEIYLGVATVPPEFRWVRGGGSCGAIVIWTGFDERRRKARQASNAQAEMAKQLEARTLFTADQVEIAARIDSTAPVVPGYPDSLYREKIQGSVLVEFIVDASGLVVMESITSISSAHPGFIEAVRRALRDARFHPAQLEGRAVRQIVQLPVKFEVESGSRGS